jgi:carbon-monoxide dehydrogenase medium subunit
MYGSTVEQAVQLDYFAPETLAEALRLLEQHGEGAKLLAGGQSLLIFLRQGLISPHTLISLKKVGGLHTVSFSPVNGLDIGATVTQVELERSQLIQTQYSALAEAAAIVAAPQVRNLGTIGGNLCHADPTADPPAALIALGAELHIAGPGGSRTVPVEAFFRDYMEVCLAETDILTRIHLPPPARHSGSAYLKLHVRAVDAALVGVAAWIQLHPEQSIIHDVRIGLAGAGVTPIRSIEAEQVLRGAPAAADVIAEAARVAAVTCSPLSDTEATEWYRREMVREFVQRAVEASLIRARAVRS